MSDKSSTPSVIGAVLEAWNERLVECTDEERLALFSTFSDGYCKECGGELNRHGVCYCWNDE